LPLRKVVPKPSGIGWRRRELGLEVEMQIPAEARCLVKQPFDRWRLAVCYRQNLHEHSLVRGVIEYPLESKHCC